MDKFEKHKLYLYSIEDISEISRKFIDAKKEKTSQRLTKKEKFKYGLLLKISEIENKLDDLDYSLMFMSIFPNYEPWRKKIFRKDYINYHLEYYYIGVIALFDRILHLVNFVYDLGLSDRFVTLDCIANNSNVDKKISSFLKKFNKALIPFRFKQNKIKHKEKTRYKDLDLPLVIEFNLKQKDVNERYSKQTQGFMKSDMNFYYKEYLGKKKTELKKNNKYLYEIVEFIFGQLFDQVEKRKIA